jgi:hypothetical protein
MGLELADELSGLLAESLAALPLYAGTCSGTRAIKALSHCNIILRDNPIYHTGQCEIILTKSSREIAELTNKQRKHVLDETRVMLCRHFPRQDVDLSRFTRNQMASVTSLESIVNKLTIENKGVRCGAIASAACRKSVFLSLKATS